MQLSNVKNMLTDWVKSGFYFGKNFSTFVAERLEVDRAKARKGSAVFDTVAGGALTYMGATGFLGTTLGALTAVTAITTAPVSALVTIVLAPVWLVFAAMTTGIGLGMLDSAREKFGISRASDVHGKVKALGAETSSALHRVFTHGKKISADFKAAVQNKTAKANAAAPAPKKPAPNNAPKP